MQHVSDSNILGHDPSWHGEACHRAPQCHNAIFSTLPHYLIASSSNMLCQGCMKIWIWALLCFGESTYICISSILQCPEIFHSENPPTIFNSTSSFLQKNICSGNPHPGSRWLERNSFPTVSQPHISW